MHNVYLYKKSTKIYKTISYTELHTYDNNSDRFFSENKRLRQIQIQDSDLLAS